jgi:hypothetical protein
MIKIKKSKILIKELLLNLIFLYVLFATTYMNMGENIYFSNHQIKIALEEYKIKDVSIISVLTTLNFNLC